MKNNSEFYIDNIKRYLDYKDLDYYDIRLEEKESTSISIENKEIKNIKENQITGIGIRIVKNNKIGFCSTTNLDNYKKIIDECILSTEKVTTKTNLQNFASNKDRVRIKFKAFSDVDIEKKVKDLLKINETLFEKNKKDDFKIIQSNLNYTELFTKKYFINDSSFICQETPVISIYSIMNGERNGVIENSFERINNIGGLELIKNNVIEKMALTNKEKLYEVIKSKVCPATTSDIILSSELGGLLAHEAIGHACEADAVLNNASVLKKGIVVGNEQINIIDNPSFNAFGKVVYDDEGIKAKQKILIKKGVVNEFITDIKTATQLGEKSNGGGRAENFSCYPIPRMSNTYFDIGKNNKDMLSNFTGYYLKGMGGGNVDPAVGTFMFGIKQAYKYKNGKIIEKYKQASISGNILTYLKNIKEIENKLGKFDPGFCGKEGQTAFVTDNAPRIKIAKVIIGGTNHE